MTFLIAIIEMPGEMLTNLDYSIVRFEEEQQPLKYGMEFCPRVPLSQWLAITLISFGFLTIFVILCLLYV
ncbi:uncharacterized protein CELE_M163.10 [Caenorhabditis elegans]|uniref:Uncharacterized protein n=1 Tax=Caenorhabditis elegans TaxID=6239 RepID=Q564X5_CAEEL|nr:Uncharacterized protein CELE_M163.10 [Caenorhabditis elegans]CAI79232.1 Uncharacterized protein CELE_M163.10 [Caenorhabditis elegans]|eukprot:NP_001024809.1 Uncharacterized protein CELE_M163.10 [Caenorhabditis elegans]